MRCLFTITQTSGFGHSVNFKKLRLNEAGFRLGAECMRECMSRAMVCHLFFAKFEVRSQEEYHKRLHTNPSLLSSNLNCTGHLRLNETFLWVRAAPAIMNFCQVLQEVCPHPCQVTRALEVLNWGSQTYHKLPRVTHYRIQCSVTSSVSPGRCLVSPMAAALQ